MSSRKYLINKYLIDKTVPKIDIKAVNRPFFQFTKRLIDVIGSLIALLILSPVFLFIYILIRCTSGSPVFFLQTRLGLEKKPFNLIKFRTMIVGAEERNGPQWASKNDDRATPVGSFLRRTRLDELPQFVNILKGDMSFVGPRPIRRFFADMLLSEIPFYSLRFKVKPGATGWAQVHYHYGGSVEGHIEKFQYDLYYIQNASVVMDIVIMLKTVNFFCRKFSAYKKGVS